MAREIGFLEALTGLVFEPGHTIEQLLKRDFPPFTFTLLTCLFVTVFVPIIAQLYKYGTEFYTIESAGSIAITLFITFFAFVLLEALFLAVVGSYGTVFDVFAVCCYCLVPLMFGLWLIYLFNFLSDGSLTLVTFLLTGSADLDTEFIKILPLAFLIIFANVLLLLYYAVKLLGQMHMLTAISVTILSVLPLYGSLMVALFFAEILRPGTIEIFLKVLPSAS